MYYLIQFNYKGNIVNYRWFMLCNYIDYIIVLLRVIYDAMTECNYLIVNNCCTTRRVGHWLRRLQTRWYLFRTWY